MKEPDGLRGVVTETSADKSWTVAYDYGLVDERGRKVGYLGWIHKGADAIYAGGRVTRNGEMFGASQRVLVCSTLDEAHVDINWRADKAHKRYAKLYGGAR